MNNYKLLQLQSTSSISSIGIWAAEKAFHFLLVLAFFLITCTELVGFQLDKAMMTLMTGALLFHFIITKKQVPTTSLWALVGYMFFILSTYLLNLPDSSLIIFFPIIGLAFMFFSSQEKHLLSILHQALFIHILVGIFFVGSSYLVGMNLHVHPMYDKGLPFLHAAKGFTTTVQAYGTLLISWFLIFYWRQDQNQLKPLDKIAFWIAILGLILTFNRNSFLTFYIIMFFRHRKVFVLTLLFAFGFYLYFFEFINKLIFNISTLSSRADLLQAFRIAFFERTDWLGYLIGHGNNMVEESIAKGTLYSTGYIENGTSVLLYTYGFLGYLLYLISVITFSIILFRKGLTFFGVLFFYIFIVAQQFTHEFFSTTIYILLTGFLLIFQASLTHEKTADRFPSTE